MASQNKNCSIVSYNLHGLKQGQILLKDMLLYADLICVQEHWLASYDFNKLYNINNNFNVVCSSAVDNKIGHGILRGRPFGGLAIFIKNNTFKNVKTICKEERFLIVVVDNIMIINIYLPCNNSDVSIDVFSAISNHIECRSNSVKHVVVCGDFNFQFKNCDPLYNVLNEFLIDNNLMCTDNFLPNAGVDEYTYCHDSLGHKSLIDHILVSNDLAHNVNSVFINHNGANLSDHSPVCLSLKLDLHVNLNEQVSGSNVNSKLPLFHSLRWDKADLPSYYESTRVNLIDIHNKLLNFDISDSLNNSNCNVHDAIEFFFSLLFKF